MREDYLEKKLEFFTWWCSDKFKKGGCGLKQDVSNPF
jgi:hypothetical protein